MSSRLSAPSPLVSVSRSSRPSYRFRSRSRRWDFLIYISKAVAIPVLVLIKLLTQSKPQVNRFPVSRLHLGFSTGSASSSVTPLLSISIFALNFEQKRRSRIRNSFRM
ncbi:hypothetical protein EVAR_47369_1 [Eumeta japonica]|uniref:Uncharacterized protein n=1 Tax=Eumeta variegata TaxID=151549 RepID=A0A4C1WWJ8_EUMVA|nr:hypothetical protein EVAR_47369_1 [Eumeta japonica]